MIVQADSEDPDLTKQKHCMIWVFTVCMRQGLFPCYSSFFFLALGNRSRVERKTGVSQMVVFPQT